MDTHIFTDTTVTVGYWATQWWLLILLVEWVTTSECVVVHHQVLDFVEKSHSLLVLSRALGHQSTLLCPPQYVKHDSAVTGMSGHQQFYFYPGFIDTQV